MADVIYNSFKKYIMDGSIDLDTDTIKVALVTSSYTADIDAHEDFADITNEVVGAGYDAGGKALTTKVTSIDDTNNRGAFDADNITWTSSTITARGAIIYKDTGTPSTSLLIGYWDFGTNKVSSAGDFTITINATGILTLT